MNDKAMPTGVVKTTDSRGIDVLLTALGSDAKPKMNMSAPAGGAAPGSTGGKPGAASGKSGGESAAGATSKPAKK
jgi:hypothetical protein